MTIEADSTKGRDHFIESWRGISIFFVVAYHFTNRVDPAALGSNVQPTLVFYSGKLGVYIFFILSGFLISLTLGGSKTLAEFYAKRISRIWPLFIFASIVIFAALQFADPPRVFEGEGAKTFNTAVITWKDLLATIFFLPQLGFRWVDGVMWSILVELKFYMFIGLTAVAFRERFVAAFGMMCAALGIAEFAIYLYIGEGDYTFANKLLHGFFIAQFLPFFAVGVMMQKRRYDGLFLINVFLCIIQTVIAVSKNPELNLYGTLEFLFVFSLILAGDWFIFQQKIFVWIGKYSFSIYLFHQTLGLMVIKALTPWIGIDLGILAAVAIIVVIAWIESWLFEWRFRRPTTRLLLQLFSLIGLDRLTIGEKAPAVQPGGIQPAASLSA